MLFLKTKSIFCDIRTPKDRAPPIREAALPLPPSPLPPSPLPPSPLPPVPEDMLFFVRSNPLFDNCVDRLHLPSNADEKTQLLSYCFFNSYAVRQHDENTIGTLQ